MRKEGLGVEMGTVQLKKKVSQQTKKKKKKFPKDRRGKWKKNFMGRKSKSQKRGGTEQLKREGLI